MPSIVTSIGQPLHQQYDHAQANMAAQTHGNIMANCSNVFGHHASNVINDHQLMRSINNSYASPIHAAIINPPTFGVDHADPR